jgi:formiminotetrahydrofolate cyclodeaminase
VFTQESKIAEFLTATAAAQPTPGGGSVVALCGALAAALGEMVVNYSIGKKQLEAHQADLQAGLAELARARQVLLQLMVEDQEAYAALSAVHKTRAEPAYTTALRACVMAPQATAATGVAILELCDKLYDKVNKKLLSDLAISAELAMAVVRGSMHNIRVNLFDVTNAEWRGRIEKDAATTMNHAAAIIQRFTRRFS